jgi:hypothetical protein
MAVHPRSDDQPVADAVDAPRKDFFPPDFGERMERQYQENLRARRAMQEAGTASGGFNPMSLGHWLDLCRLALVVAVPAVCIGRIGVDTLLSDDPAAKQFESRLKESMAAFGEGWMARWDCCSMAETKYRLSEGLTDWSPELAWIFADDCRACDIISDFPDLNIAAWARPWVTFAIHEGWPVEYRAFVHNDEVIGVSNYYPQRALPDNAATASDIERVRLASGHLIHCQTRPLNCPRLEGFDMKRNHWTADFARLPSGAIVFLEGGPPHTMTGGAHPCCFLPGETEGVALEARWDVRGDGAQASTTDGATEPGTNNERPKP